MDIRVEKTKRSIINAFLEIRSKKPLEKITVKELAELAYINKATFYLHYKDIYDLSEQLEAEVVSTIVKGIPHPDLIITNPRLIIEELTISAISQNNLTNILFSGSRAPIYEQQLEHQLKEHIFKLYPEYKYNIKIKIILSIILHNSFYLFSEFGTTNNTDEILQLIGDINECLIENFINKN